MIRQTGFFSFPVALLGLAFGLSASAAPTSFSEAAQQPGTGPDPRPVTVPAPTGTVTIFTDRASFQIAHPGLPLEDFEEGDAPAAGFLVCDAPVDETGDATCGFAKGDILPGVAFQDNPGPELAAMILLGANAALNPSQALIANTFADSFDILFDPPVSAAGMDLHSTPALGQGPPDVMAIQIFDVNDVLIDTDPTAAASGAGNFWGVSSSTPIGRISILSTNNQAEGVDNIEFAGQPFISMGTVTTMDVCAATPANNNSIIEPGEVVNLTIPLSASAGDFTNVAAVLSSGTAGINIVNGMGNYGTITAGNSASANYSIQLDETVACLSSFDLTLSVTSTEGNFSFPIMRNVGQSAAFVYSGLPLSIPDNNPTGASSTATVAGVPGPLTSVQVSVNLTHTWVGDLIFTLTSAEGTVVTLLDRPGVPASGAGCSDDNVVVTFVDGQANPEDTCAGSGTWPVTLAAPVTALSTLNGEDANGTWTLNISDNAGADLGTLNSWELILLPAAAGTCNVCVGADADVSLVKTATAPNPLSVGDNINYTLTASNAGPGDAAGVVVTDTLPLNVTYVSDSCGATFVAPTLTWNIGTLANGANAACSLIVTVNSAGDILNTASVTTSSTDPNGANNTGTSALVGGVAVPVPVLGPWTLLLLGFGFVAIGMRVARR